MNVKQLFRETYLVLMKDKQELNLTIDSCLAKVLAELQTRRSTLSDQDKAALKNATIHVSTHLTKHDLLTGARFQMLDQYLNYCHDSAIDAAIHFLCTKDNTRYQEIKCAFQTRFSAVSGHMYVYQRALNDIPWSELSLINLERLYWIFEQLNTKSLNINQKKNLFDTCLKSLGQLMNQEQAQEKLSIAVDFEIFLKLSNGLLLLNQTSKPSLIATLLLLLQHIKVQKNDVDRFMKFCEDAIFQVSEFVGYTNLFEALFVHRKIFKTFGLMLKTSHHCVADKHYFTKRLIINFKKFVEEDYRFTLEEIKNFYDQLSEAPIEILGVDFDYNIFRALNQCDFCDFTSLPEWVVSCFREIPLTDDFYERSFHLFLDLCCKIVPPANFLEICCRSTLNQDQIFKILNILGAQITKGSCLNFTDIERVYDSLIQHIDHQNHKYFHAYFVKIFLPLDCGYVSDSRYQLTSYYQAYKNWYTKEQTITSVSHQQELLGLKYDLLKGLQDGRFYALLDFHEHEQFYNKLIDISDDILSSKKIEVEIQCLRGACHVEVINPEEIIGLFTEVIAEIQGISNCQETEKRQKREQKKRDKLNQELELQLDQWCQKKRFELIEFSEQISVFLCHAEGLPIEETYEFKRVKFNYLLNQGDYLPAERLLNSMYADVESSPNKYEDYATYYYATSNISKSLEYIQKLISAQNHTFATKIRLTKWQQQCYYILGRYEQAISAVDALIATCNNPGPLARCVLLKVELLIKLKEYEAAQELLAKYNLEFPQIESKHARSEFYCLLEDKKYLEAEIYLNKNKKLFSEPNLSILYTQCFIQRCQYHRALNYLKKSIDKFGELSELKVLEGFILYCLKAYEDSLAVYQQLYACEERPQYQFFIATICAKIKNNWPEIECEWKQLTTQFPDYKAGYLGYLRACVLHDQNTKLEEIKNIFLEKIGKNAYWQGKLDACLGRSARVEKEELNELHELVYPCQSHLDLQYTDTKQSGDDIFKEAIFDLIGEDNVDDRRVPFCTIAPVRHYPRRFEYHLFNKGLRSRIVEGLDLASYADEFKDYYLKQSDFLSPFK